MKKILLAAAAVVTLTVAMSSCKGRTQENMTPDSDTVEVIDGGEVVMNPSDSDTTVIADSPAEANAQAQAQTDSTNVNK